MDRFLDLEAGDGLVAFNVIGTAKPQGSKTAYTTPSGKTVMTEAVKGVKEWRQSVADTAYINMLGHEQIDGPVEVWLRFYFQRPKSHYGKGANSDKLNTRAPAAMTLKPDLDKLTRAVLDGLTGVCFGDDSQVCRVVASKRYCTGDILPHAAVIVGEMADE